jgi:hypothetical protein
MGCLTDGMDALPDGMGRVPFPWAAYGSLGGIFPSDGIDGIRSLEGIFPLDWHGSLGWHLSILEGMAPLQRHLSLDGRKGSFTILSALELRHEDFIPLPFLPMPLPSIPLKCGRRLALASLAHASPLPPCYQVPWMT